MQALENSGTNPENTENGRFIEGLSSASVFFRYCSRVQIVYRKAAQYAFALFQSLAAPYKCPPGRASGNSSLMSL